MSVKSLGQGHMGPLNFWYLVTFLSENEDVNYICWTGIFSQIYIYNKFHSGFMGLKAMDRQTDRRHHCVISQRACRNRSTIKQKSSYSWSTLRSTMYVKLNYSQYFPTVKTATAAAGSCKRTNTTVSTVKWPGDLDLWPFDLESGVRVMCDMGYLCQF